MWKPVVGFEGFYEVSDEGRVRSLPRRVNSPVAGGSRVIPGRERKLTTHPSGHLIVSLSRPGEKLFMAKVHRLVLEAFVGPCPDGMECCHNNSVPSDNRLANLRWDTPSENQLDKRRHGRLPNRCKNGHPYPSDERKCEVCARDTADRKNARDRATRSGGPGRGSWQSQKTHCKHGHEFTPENTYVNTVSGCRQCRACAKARRKRKR